MTTAHSSQQRALIILPPQQGIEDAARFCVCETIQQTVNLEHGLIEEIAVNSIATFDLRNHMHTNAKARAYTFVAVEHRQTQIAGNVQRATCRRPAARKSQIDFWAAALPPIFRALLLQGLLPLACLLSSLPNPCHRDLPLMASLFAVSVGPPRHVKFWPRLRRAEWKPFPSHL